MADTNGSLAQLKPQAKTVANRIGKHHLISYLPKRNEITDPKSKYQRMPEMLHIVALFKLQDILLFTVASPTFDVMPDLRNLLRRIVIKVYNAPKPGFHYSPVRNISKEIAGDIIAAMKLIFRAVNGSPSPIFKPNLLDSFQEIVLMMDCLICNPQTSNDREDYNIQEQLWNLDTLVEESEAKLKRAA